MRWRVSSMMPNWLIRRTLVLARSLAKLCVETFLEFAAMALEAQVDEIADDHAAEIAEAKLAGNFVGGFHVGFEGGCFGVGVLAEFAAVDVDGDDRPRCCR